MSSYGTSMNQSTESGTSSLLRSGLNISVGDTKSIVLALQALQQKIRALEQDRDYHQEQYDNALQAHEAYKLDVAKQTEKERAEHRRREQELMDLLRAAREEKIKLESTMSGSRDDLSAFRSELEKMIETEKHQSQQRESKLRGEIARLREETSKERAKHEAMVTSLEKLRAEREDAYETNDELRAAVADLERLRRRDGSTRPAERDRSRTQRGPPRRGRGLGRAGQTSSFAKASYVSPRHASRDGKDSARSSHRTYQDPTCSSRLRDVHHAEDDISCSCVANGIPGEAGVSSFVRGDSSGIEAGMTPPGYDGRGRTQALNRSASSNSGTRSRTTSASARREHHSHGAANAAAAAWAPQHSHSRHASVHLGPHRAADGADPLHHVELQLQEELADLQREYRNTVSRAATESLPRNIVTTALERISELLDKKEDQLRLMQAARREVRVTSNTPPGAANTAAAVAAGRTAQRAVLVNELKGLLVNESAKL